jgi:hypothetical protein
MWIVSFLASRPFWKNSILSRVAPLLWRSLTTTQEVIIMQRLVKTMSGYPCSKRPIMRLGIRLSAVTAAMIALLLFLVSSPAWADGSLSASRSGVKSTAYVTFTGRYDFKVSSWKLSDTSCDSSSVIAYVFNNFGEIKQRENSTGCRSTVSMPDVHWHSSRGRTEYVYLRVCVNSIGHNECTSGARQYNPYP